jgi:hypothetical protein
MTSIQHENGSRYNFLNAYLALQNNKTDYHNETAASLAGQIQLGKANKISFFFPPIPSIISRIVTLKPLSSIGMSHTSHTCDINHPIGPEGSV